MKKILIPLSATAVLLAGCVSGPYKPVDNLAKLDVSFVDPAWDGKTVPKIGICQPYEGKGDTPALKVKGIPAGANAIVVEYSDRSFAPMDNGGHGVLRYTIAKGQAEVVLPATPGMTDKMPEGVTIESNNRGQRNVAPGYRGPCSGGRGNLYEGVVKAVFKGANDKEQSLLLGEGKFSLGRY